ncbi:DUF4347 domain-containing protein, partial [Microcoleus sp. herbarium12]|uniref:DUF4347 domain-containing protein n=1 Tax=Microcoleus sp. herbarium12 TaxID=3055437 RepID=UPI002FD403CA
MKTIPTQSNMSALETRKYINIATKILSASYKAESASFQNLAIVDSKVENYEQLLAGVKLGTEVILLDRARDGIEQIAEILAWRHSINSIQIVAHGSEAAVKLGSAELNIHNIETYTSQLQQWGKALNSTGSILLLSCNTGAGESGLKFIQKLSEITGANVAASNNLTGSAALGGDWELEIAIGQINAELAFEKEVLEAYTSVLATLVAESFTGTTALGPWIYGTSGVSANPGLTSGTGPGIIPGLTPTLDPAGSGALRLTSAVGDQAAFVIYNNPISASEGVKVTFDLFAYGGSGADGVSFFLIDGTTTPTAAGGYGGSLGYAPNTTGAGVAGIAGGYVGVGLDEFGNFSNPTEGRVGGTVATADSVALRGSVATNYNFLTNALVPGGIDNTAATTRTGAKKTVQITLLPGTNQLTVAIDLNGDGIFVPTETLIDIPNLTLVNGAIPPTFKFGFASSTGGQDNIHEISNLVVESVLPPALQADIVTAKISPQFASPNSNITYTITSSNNGPSPASDLLIQDQLPAGLTFVSASDGGTFNPATGAIVWPLISSLASGTSVTRTIVATVPGTLGTSLTNTAFSNSSTFDPNPVNNNGSSTVSQSPVTVAVADLVTTKTGSATAIAGTTVSYTITTVNNGPSTATNVTVTDSIVPGLIGVSVSNGGTYNSTTGIVTFPAINILSGAPAVANTVSFVSPDRLSISNTASSTSATPDSNPANNNGSLPTATVVTALTPPNADLATTKTGPATAIAGTTVSYTISTVNNGPSTATNVTVTDSIVPGLIGVSVSNGGTYNSTTGIVTFPAINILSGAPAVANTVSFVSPGGASVSNTASSTSATPDANPANNNGSAPGATVTTALTPTADLVTTKTG